MPAPQLLDGKRDGLALPEKERTELTSLKKELSQVCLEFSVRVCFTHTVTPIQQ